MTDNISITIETEDDDVPEPSFMCSVVQMVCNNLGDATAQINIQVVDEPFIRKLNHQYRDKDAATNVLSFSADLPDWIEDNLKGDIVLCPSVIRTEAQRYNKSLNCRWAHMLIHGCLHLFGMSHDDEFTQNKMEAKELEIMTALGFDDPYGVF